MMDNYYFCANDISTALGCDVTDVAPQPYDVPDTYMGVDPVLGYHCVQKSNTATIMDGITITITAHWYMHTSDILHYRDNRT